MSRLFDHIPFAILENLLLMGMGFAVYKGIEWYTAWKASLKYSIAILFQISGAIHFMSRCIFPPSKAYLWVPNFSNLNFKIADLLPYFGMVYLLVLVVYLVKLFFQIIQLQAIRQGADFSKHTELFHSFTETNTVIPDKIKLGTSTQINSPIIFGFWEPIILLPASIFTYLSPEQIKLILLHELAHIYRNDYLIQLLLRVVQCILWFNPFVYLLNAAIELQREMCCDEWVMKKMNAPIPYSKALFQIANQLVRPNISLSIGAATNKNDLLLRLQYLNGIRVDYPKKFSFIFILLLGIGAFILLSNPIFKKQSFPTKEMVYQKENTPIVNAHLNNDVFLPLHKSAKKKTHSILKNENNQHLTIESNYPTDNSFAQNENIHYSDLVDQTKRWIHSLENPVRFAGWSDYALIQDSVENSIIEKLVLTAIIKNYQLKKTLLEDKLAKATNVKEASDYLMNSKEWAEILEYEKWVREYQQKH